MAVEVGREDIKSWQDGRLVSIGQCLVPSDLNPTIGIFFLMTWPNHSSGNNLGFDS